MILTKRMSDFSPFISIKRFFRNKYWMGAVVLALIIGAIYFITPEALAEYANTESVKTNYGNFIKGAQLNSIEFMQQAFTSFEHLYSPKGGISFPVLINAVVGILAGGAIVIYFGVNIIKEAQNADLTIEYWQKVILRLVLSLTITLLSTRIMGALYDIGVALVGVFSESTKTGALDNINQDAMSEVLSKIPGMESLTQILKGQVVNYEKIESTNDMLVMLELVVWFPMVIAIFLMYSAIFEIKIREIFAPYAVTSIMVEGGRSGGARYLKKYIACFLQIAIYFALAYIGMQMSTYFYNQIGQGQGNGIIDLNLIFMLMSNVVAAMAMMQTGGIADEVIGV